MNKWKNFKAALCLGIAMSMAVVSTVSANVTGPSAGPGGETGQTPGQGQHTQQSQTGSSSPSRLPALSGTVTTSQGNGTTGTAGTNPSQGTASGSLETPVVASQGAVLYDALNNRFLFEQNADTRFYPASITKLMTALLVLERSSLDDTVTFSENAVTNLEAGAVTLKIKAGDKFSVKDCMYALLLKSANEVANGLAEHVAGSVSGFADLMNQKAASLGCTNTHFVNPNGLNDSNHYTTARDMALIAKAAFENQTLSQIASTVSYDFPATASVPTVRKLTMGHKMVNPANGEYYQGIVGGKTGYTSLAGNTLVTCAERDGKRLIAVVLKSKQTHYTDTKALLDYGFAYLAAEQNPAGGQQSGQQTGPGGTAPSSPAGGPGANARDANKWIQNGQIWQFVKADGTYARNESMMINNEIYHFNNDSQMVTGWNQIDGIWYFFRNSGGLAKTRWVETNGMWYYVDDNGSLFTGGTTPDGFLVDENGVWVQ